MCFTSICSQTVYGLSSHALKVCSFTGQKFLILVKSTISIYFSFMEPAFGAVSKTHGQTHVT